MKTVYSVYEAKTKLSEILRRVGARRQITITDRGRPVARVVPIAEEKSLDERLSRLEAAGVLHRAKQRPGSITSVARRPGALRRFLADRE